MNAKEIYQFMNENPTFTIATVENDQPRVRNMLLYKADENGIIFHTGPMKDAYKQICANPKVEMCFLANGTQIRVAGVLEDVTNDALLEEITAHPSRKFLQAFKDAGMNVPMTIYSMKGGSAVTWTFADNFKPKNYIQL